MKMSSYAKSLAWCLVFSVTLMGIPCIAVSANEVKATTFTTGKEENTSGSAISGGAVSGGAIVTPTPVPLDDVSVYKPDTPKVTVRGGSKRVRVQWKKIDNADGYYVYYRPATSVQYKKVATITDKKIVEYDKKSLEQNTTYHFLVSAYRNVNGYVVESNLSSSVSAKTVAVSATSKKAKVYGTKAKFKKSPAYKKFTKMKSSMNYSKSFAIPGMVSTNVGGFSSKNMVPQAICHAGSYLLISAYDSKGVDYSVVYVVSKAAKSYITTIVLPSKAKVGGMAYDGTNIWISKGSSVAYFPYTVVTDAVNAGTAYTTLKQYNGVFKVTGTASYMGYYDEILWVGAFKQSSSSMIGYRVENKTTTPSLKETYTMAVPSKTQGITFQEDGTLVLTRGYKKNTSESGYISQIRTYMPSYENASVGGKVLKNSVRKKTKMPPKIEGVAIYGTYTYTLFSSAHYGKCKYPVDRVIALKTNKLLN